MIKVNNLDKHFNKRKRNAIHVLNDVSIDFPNKGLVVLLGRSGSGKTTLLNVISGLDKTDKGLIEFGDHKISKYNAALWDKIRSEEIGYIFQNYYLLPNLSVFDNVAFVLKMMGINDENIIKERVEYILTQIGMFRFRKKRSTQLSGGQMQRVAIARALVKNPEVIIADEPTGNLDSANSLEVMNIIKEISKTKLVVLVTHEKELANYYADRIIEISDGKIVNDFLNESNDDHHFDEENVVYLKDLNEISNFNDEKLKVNYYSDDEEELKDLTNIKLIIKNKTLYIDVDSEFKKVSLIGSDSNLLVRDEHFVKKDRKDTLKTTFTHETLDTSNIEREKRSVVSFKTSFWLAFRKILNFGRKGKLMLLLFFLSGTMIAQSVINIYTTLSLDYKRFITVDENYLLVKAKTNHSTNYENIYNDISNLFSSTDDFYIIDGKSTFSSYQFVLGEGYVYPMTNNLVVQYSGQLKDSTLLHGRLPQNEKEIVISKAFYETDDVLSTNDFSEIGIWDINNLIGEKITSYFSSGVFEIVGISNDSYETFYTYNHVSYQQINGTIIQSNISTTAPELYKQIIKSNNEFYLYSKDKTVKTKLENLGYTADSTSKVAIDKNKTEIAISFASNIFGSILIVGGALLAFYFVMRSSMIARIYEISVYRALGVKRHEIVTSFGIEIITLTTISTFLGYIFMSIILGFISNSPLGVLLNYKVDFLSFLIGFVIIYGINLIIGLLPVFGLLRKTPAQIISSYDM